MKILLSFDDKFPVNKTRLVQLIQQKVKYVEFCLYEGKLVLPSEPVTKPKTFLNVCKQLNKIQNNYDKIFCFTLEQYYDNYFLHEHSNLAIFSFFAWDYMTDLPLSNGILYFIVDYLALHIDPKDFRHHETTGCIYDFLKDKRGVDEGMRQAKFCPNCLKRISKSLAKKEDFKVFEDLKVLMNFLSDTSKWNKDILATKIQKPNSIAKRNPKNADRGIRVVIASPSDTVVERELLLNHLEVRFRVNNHEDRCGFRILVTGWERLASQPGYPQDKINKKIIAESDFVIAVFRHRLETPTVYPKTGRKRAESGTAEELLKTLDTKEKNLPIGMAYFFSQAPLISLDNPDRNKIQKEWGRLSKFKKGLENKMIFKPYTDEKDLISNILIDLEKNIIDNFIKRKPAKKRQHLFAK